METGVHISVAFPLMRYWYCRSQPPSAFSFRNPIYPRLVCPLDGWIDLQPHYHQAVIPLDAEIQAAAAASLDVMNLRTIQIEKSCQSFRHEFEEDGDHKISYGEIFLGKLFIDAVRIDEMRVSDRSVDGKFSIIAKVRELGIVFFHGCWCLVARISLECSLGRCEVEGKRLLVCTDFVSSAFEMCVLIDVK